MIKVEEDKMGGSCSRNSGKKKRPRIDYWWESHRKKRPLGKPRCRWVDNITMDLGETGWGGVDWVRLAQDMEIL
jgi:hypothetical protein